MSLLEGKAIAITGAGSGIGAAYARHCAKLGARIVVNDLVADAAEAEFVPALAFLKQRHDPLRALALGLVEINPGK